jgi:hypothetical protein
MQQKLNHHFLPRFYLKGFASESDTSHIWEYQRGRAYLPGKNNRDKYNPVLMSLRKAGAAIGEYAYPRADGTVDFNSYEDALEQLEKPANIVFDKIRNLERIDSSDRDIFAGYMATMTRRVPARKELVKTQFPLVLEDGWRTITDELESAISQVDPSDQGRIDVLTTRLAACRLIIEEYRRSGMPREMELKTIVESTMPRIHEAMIAMTWQFLVAPEDHKFVTSDNPVHTFKGGVGFSKPYSELTFTVSARVALLGTYRKVQEGYVNVKPQLLKEINRRVIANASVYVYSPSKERWVLTVMGKKFHRFNLIYAAPELSGSLRV